MRFGSTLFRMALLSLLWQPGHAFALDLTVHPGSIQAQVDDMGDAKAQVDEVPGNAALIDNSAWNGQHAATTKDITDYVPGVYTQYRNGAESARLSIRGSGLANTFQGRGLMVFQDSVPINMADGEFEFPVIDPWLIQYAQVFPGANALSSGDNTLGGSINFVTPTGLTSPGNTIRFEAGSFGTAHGLVSTGQSFGNADIFAALDGFYQDGFRDNNRQYNTRLNANIGWRPNDTLETRFVINHTTSDPQIPGAISRAEISDDPSQANPNNIRGQYERDLDITRIAQRTAWQDGPNRLDTTVFYTYRSLVNPVTTYTFEHNNDVGARTAYTRDIGLNQFTTGFNIYYGTQDETRYRNALGSPGRHILDRDLYATTAEAYTQYQQHLYNRLFGIIGIQGSYAVRNIDQSTPTSAEQDQNYAGANPRIGLRYDLAPETQLFTNLSRSFEPPTFSELSGGNTPTFNRLNAQTATTFEIGARSMVNDVHLSAAAYHSRVHDEFVNYEFPDGTSDTINARRSIHDGLELGANGDLMHNLWREDDAISFRAAYTLSLFHLDNDPLYGDNRLPGIPEHYLRAEALYRHPSGFSFGPNIEWAPTPYPVDLTNTVNTKGYAIYGARAEWTGFAKRLNLYIEGRNLLNDHYIATTNVVPDAGGQDGRYFYPGEGRALYAGMQLHF